MEALGRVRGKSKGTSTRTLQNRPGNPRTRTPRKDTKSRFPASPPRGTPFSSGGRAGILYKHVHRNSRVSRVSVYNVAEPEVMWREVCVCVRACGREVRLGFACGCVLERVVCRVRFARVSCPWLRFERTNLSNAVLIRVHATSSFGDARHSQGRLAVRLCFARAAARPNAEDLDR